MTNVFSDQAQGHMNERYDVTSTSTIRRFYSGANVLVTGATGFMGKVLVEKLLRSCPGIENIFMLVREKKGRSMEERVDDLVTSPCFDNLKGQCPQFRGKLRAVAGDIGLEGLGLSHADREVLQEKVDIVFHVAASVRFDECLQQAIIHNVRGTRDMLTLCRDFKRLKAYVHVSTAYSHGTSDEPYISERFHEPPLSPEGAIRIAETLDPSTVDALSHKLLGKWPNAYTFTKAISEDAVKTYGEGLPIGVMRPSIVLWSMNEPVPGWVDSPFGPAGLVAATACGLLRVMISDVEKSLSSVPCDMAINAIITSAWHVAHNSRSRDIPIYNFTLPKASMTMKIMIDEFFKVCEDCPPSRCVWYPVAIPLRSPSLVLIYQFLLHLLPAIVIDALLMARGQKPQLCKAYGKIHKFTRIMGYFLTHEWEFDDRNTWDLWDKLESEDKNTFFFDVRTLNWDEFFKKSSPGLRQFLLKDPPDTIPAAKIRMKRLLFLHRFTQMLLLVLVSWWLKSLLWPYLGM